MHPFASMLVTLFLQAIAGLLLGFNLAYTVGFGGGRELLLIGLGTAVGVWGIGAAADLLRERAPSFWASGGALAGALLGVLLILITPPFGFAALLLPVLGALPGYYLVWYIGSRR